VIAQRCHQVVIVADGATVPTPAPRRQIGGPSPPRLVGNPFQRRASSPQSAFQDEPFDVVHVFRLATLEHVRPWLVRAGSRPARHLDLDDVESITRRRIGDLHERVGQSEAAQIERAAADRASVVEAELLRDFERIYVCSEGDRRALDARRGAGAHARIEVMPNGLPIPAPLPPPPPDLPYTFFFVGTLAYFPNEDAIITFCRETLPQLRQTASRPFRIAIGGVGMTPAIQALAALPEVELLGALPRMADGYARAHAAIVPIRAGGGTRIKILEAFAYRRPVVTTTIGAEGIAARHDEHLLIADDPDEFARQCARLMSSPELTRGLTDRAEAKFRAEYSLDALVQRVKALPER
jgi:glycosyltransferase involved in cell wall biosynthesis